MPEQTSSPYIGPRFFERTAADQERFFGRDRETQEIVSLIYSHPLLLVYAQSGAGKTSLFNAQIAPTLEERGFQVLPLARVYGALPERDDPTPLDNPYLTNVLLCLKPKADLASLAGRSLADVLRALPRGAVHTGAAHPDATPPLSARPRPRVLVLDQFEELFLHYPVKRRARQEAFFQQVTEALDDDPLLRCVFVIREDYLAQLDPFVELLPEELRIRFRLERLRHDAALDAIVKPLPKGYTFAEGVADQLVEDLLTIQVQHASGETVQVKGEFVEPVQLQIVCENLWQRLPSGTTTIQQSHLQGFGDVTQALSDFYVRCIHETARQIETKKVRELDLHAWFNENLITSAGTRGIVFRDQNNKFMDAQSTIPVEAIETLEGMHLIRGEQRAGGWWYELTHDRFIEPIQRAFSAALREERQKLQKEQEELQKLQKEHRERLRNWAQLPGKLLVGLISLLVGYTFLDQEYELGQKVKSALQWFRAFWPLGPWLSALIVALLICILRGLAQVLLYDAGSRDAQEIEPMDIFWQIFLFSPLGALWISTFWTRVTPAEMIVFTLVYFASLFLASLLATRLSRTLSRKSSPGLPVPPESE